MKAVVYILLATGFTYYVARFAGALLLQIVLRNIGLKLYRSEQRFFAFVGGAACLSVIVYALTSVGLARKAVFIPAGMLILIAGFWRGVHRDTSPDLPPIPRLWKLAFWAIYLTFGWLYLSQALAPETSSDGVSYHLPLIARYLREHHFPHITTNMYANLSQGIEMLFMFAFSIGKHSAAAMVEFLFLAILPFGMLSYARRIGKPAVGVVGALLFYVSPVVGRAGTIAYVDVAVACIGFALFYLLQIWREQPEDRLLVLIGLIAGFGYAAKYTAAVGIIYALLFTAFWTWRWKRPLWKPAAIIGICAFAMMAPWMIKNAIIVANPFSPFLNRFFPNPYTYYSFERDYVSGLMHTNGVRLSEIPLEVTIHGGRLMGLIGPLFLLAPLSLLALRSAAGRQLLLAAAVFGAPYFMTITARFLIPALPFIALALALALENLPLLAPLVLAAQSITCWPAIVGLYCAPYTWRIEGSTWKAALRRIPEAQYIRQHLPDYDMGRILERLVPPNESVLSGYMSNRAYQSREILIPYESTLGMRLYDMLIDVLTEDRRPAARHVFQFPERAVRRIRLVETRKAPELWAFSELRIFLHGQEIPRSAGWRLRASANPWEVQLAFDNSPVTLWNARRPAGPGMYVQIDFGAVQSVDRLTADLPSNVNQLAMRVDAEIAPGWWEVLQDKPAIEKIPYPPRMRRAAIEEMKASGIDWMVTTADDPISADFIGRAVQWGIRQAAHSHGYRLWHLE